jgi:hypothetical protein
MTTTTEPTSQHLAALAAAREALETAEQLVKTAVAKISAVETATHVRDYRIPDVMAAYRSVVQIRDTLDILFSEDDASFNMDAMEAAAALEAPAGS